MRDTATVKFRPPAALAVAGVVALIGAIPLVGAAPWLAPLLLVPLAVAAWAWRAGTDANAEELRVRALLGTRRLPWDHVVEIALVGDRQVVAVLSHGGSLPLTAVRPADVPRLVAASGRESVDTTGGR